MSRIKRVSLHTKLVKWYSSFHMLLHTCLPYGVGSGSTVLIKERGILKYPCRASEAAVVMDITSLWAGNVWLAPLWAAALGMMQLQIDAVTRRVAIMVVSIALLLNCIKVTFLSEIVNFYQQVGGENSTNWREMLVVNWHGNSSL